MKMGLRFVAVVALLAFGLGGCGSDDTGGSPAPGKDAAPEQDGAADAAVDSSPDAVERGVVRGTAQLFGQQNHEGIEVGVEGTTLTVSTSPTGEFELTDVPAGTITLTASLSPYQTERRVGVHVEAGKTSSVDSVVLRLGKLLQPGESCIPLGFSPSGEHALFGTDFSPFLGTGTLFAHDIQKEASIEAGSSVALMTVVPSPDGRFLAAVRDMAVSSGVGELVGIDLASGEVKSLSQTAAAGVFWFSRDSQYLTYLADFDMSDQSGDLRIVSTTDWSERVLASNVHAGSIEEPEGESALYFASDVSYTDMTGDLYRYEFGAIDAEKVDSGVLVGRRWLGGDGQPLVYVKNVQDYVMSTLAAWSPGESPRTLATSVLHDSVYVSSDETELLVLADYAQAVDEGKLQRWIVGPSAPSTVAERVQSNTQASPDGSKVIYVHDRDAVTSQGTLAAWDFATGASQDLGTSAAPWRVSVDGQRMASFATFDDLAQVGDLHVFDFATGESVLVAADASPNVIEFDPSGTWLAFQVNPIADTFMGDLWLHDTSTGQNTLLAETALPVTWWSETTPLVGFYDDPDEEFTTAILRVRAMDVGKTVSLGRALFMADQLYFGPTGSWVAFYRNPSTEDMAGDLWVWDGAVDPWEGTDLGIEVRKNVGFWSVGVHPEGLLLTSDVSPTWDSATLSWWSRGTRQTTVLGNEVMPDAWMMSPERDRMVFFANAKGQPVGDLHYVELEDPKPELLGAKVHMQGVWLDEAWTRMVFVANTVGDLGEVTTRDLKNGTSRVVGSSAPFFGLGVSPDGATLAFLHDWDTAKTVGTLSVLELGDTDVPPVPYDDYAPLTFRLSDDHVLYVVQGDERSGIYLAPSL